MAIATASYEQGKLTVYDAVTCGKKGKKCGKICIPKKSTCRKNQSPSLKNSNAKIGPANTGIAIATGIAATSIAAGLVGGALIAAPAKIKKDYVDGFKKSAAIAQKQAKILEATTPKLDKNIKTAIFTVGGYGTKDAFSESVKLQNNINSLGIKDTYIEPIEYKELNIKNNPQRNGAAKAGKEALRKLIDVAVNKKHNPVARKVAAKVLAMQSVNPHVKIQLVGHSGGGLAIQETNEILHTIGKSVRVTAIGSPDLGLIPGNGDTVTASSKNDGILKMVKGRVVNGMAFDNVPEHGQNSYFADEKFRKFMSARLGITKEKAQKIDSIRFDKRMNCRLGKQCGDICIPLKSVCRKNSPTAAKINNPSAAVAAGAIAGATLLAIPLSVYAVQKARFKANFPESAKLAKEQAKNYSVPEKIETGYRSIADQSTNVGASVKSRFFAKKPQQITFFAGGVGAVKGLEADYMGQHFAKMMEDHHVVGIETPEQEVAFEKGDHVAKPSYIKKVVKAFLGDNLKKGRSEVAVRIAARAYAYHQKHPKLPINLVGQSGGTMPVREAHEILKQLKVKDVRVVTAGGPYFGLTSPEGLSLIDRQNDPVYKIYGATMPNKKDVKVKGHSQYWSEVPYKQIKDGQWTGEISDNIYEQAVPNLTVKKVVSEYLDRSKKIVKDSLVFNLDSTQSELEQKLKIVISRAYGQPINKIGSISVDAAGIAKGLFAVNGKIFSFTFDKNKLKYKISSGQRLDSLQIHFDRKNSGKPKCKVGTPCGDACIPKNHACELNATKLGSPAEINSLNSAIAKIKQEQTPQAENNYEINPKTKKPYTIRELRVIAAQKRVVGYGSMSTSELKAAIKLVDKNPNSRIVSSRGLGSKAVGASGLSGRNRTERKAKRELRDIAATSKRLEALIKFSGSAPVAWTAAAVGAFLVGTTIRTYERTKANYREGFDESAKLAQERAVKINLRRPLERDGEIVRLADGRPRMISNPPQDNITFVVSSGKGYGAEKMKRLLQREKDPNGDPGEYWFSHSNYVIPFNLQETGITKGAKGTNKEIVDGIKSYLDNFKRKRNQDAVDLAANIYAYGIAIKKDDPKVLLNKYKKINVLAHGIGGQTVKEALEILARMDIKGSPTGKDILGQVNCVYLGTPHFGFAENVSKNQRTIVSAQDPVSSIPAFGDGARNQWISSVKDHSVESYLEDRRVRETVLEAFGYYENSLLEIRRRLAKSRERGDSEAYTIQLQASLADIFKKDTNAKCSSKSKLCGNICIPRMHKCRKTSVNSPDSQTRGKIAAGLLAAGAVGATVGLAAGHVSSKITVANTPKSQLSLVSQKELDDLSLTGSAPKQGASGRTFFVKNSQGQRSLFKEINHPFKLLEASAEATVSDIAKAAGIKINEVKMIPSKLKSPLKKGRFGASLHSVVPGRTLTEEVKENTASPYRFVNIKQTGGLNKDMLPALGLHPDIAKIAALDTFTGNWDRKGDNLMYDAASDSFAGIDSGLAFSSDLAQKTYRNLKDLNVSDLSKDELNGLQTYVDTLKKIHGNKKPDIVKSRYSAYISQEKGDWNIVKRYGALTNIDNSYKNTKKLIKSLEAKIQSINIKKDSVDRFDKKCGKGFISNNLTCRLNNSNLSNIGSSKPKLMQEDKIVKALSGSALGVAAITVGLASGVALSLTIQDKENWDRVYKSKNTLKEVQQYDSSLPTPNDFKRATWKQFSAVQSGSKEKGDHPIQEAVIDNKRYFVKKGAKEGGWRSPDISIAKEVFASDVAGMVGLRENVLPAMRLDIKNKPHVVTRMLERNEVADLGNVKNMKKALKNISENKIGDYLLFDYMIHNKSRHEGNILFKPNGDLFLIDHGSVKKDLPFSPGISAVAKAQKVNARLDTQDNFLYKEGIDKNNDFRLSPESLKKYLEQKSEIIAAMRNRYSGQPKLIVEPTIQALEKRFEIIESMLVANDTRIKYLVTGKTVEVKKRIDSFLKHCSSGTKKCGETCISSEKTCRLNYSPNHKKHQIDRLKASFGRGLISQSVGGLGQDLERAYLRTERLINQQKNKKKIKTKREILKEAALHEARLLGVQLGQGSVSKKFKDIDKKLVDFRESREIASNQIQEKVSKMKADLSKFVESKTKSRNKVLSEN